MNYFLKENKSCLEILPVIISITLNSFVLIKSSNYSILNSTGFIQNFGENFSFRFLVSSWEVPIVSFEM